jgi:uncharacterized lipoprotein YmbA
MSKRTVSWFWAACLALLIAGCGSSPSNRYYVLTAENPNVPEGNTPSLGVGPVAVPEYLSGNKLVYNQQGNALEVAGSSLWAEPLEDGISRVLAINLASELDTQNVRRFPWHPERKPDYGISVRVLALDADDKEAVLAAEWLVYDPDTARSINRRIIRLATALPDGDLQPADIAPAYSELLLELSKIIAEAIRTDLAQADAGETPA